MPEPQDTRTEALTTRARVRAKHDLLMLQRGEARARGEDLHDYNVHIKRLRKVLNGLDRLCEEMGWSDPVLGVPNKAGA